MKNFLKHAAGVPSNPEMNALMTRQDAFSPTGVKGVTEIVIREFDAGERVARDAAGAKEFPGLKLKALRFMSVLEGVQLGRVVLLRIDPKAYVPIGNDSLYFQSYLIVLYALSPTLVTAGDESVQVVGGDYWWADLRQDASLLNSSDDEVFAMIVDIRIDP